jgi:hypothetical protein
MPRGKGQREMCPRQLFTNIIDTKLNKETK